MTGVQTCALPIYINNSGPATLNINGLGDVEIKKDNGSGLLTPLTTGDLKGGSLYTLYYNGVSFQKEILTVHSSISTQNRYYIQPTETVTVATYSQYLIYGNFTVDGVLDNYGQVVILNGSLDLSSGGTFSNSGTLIIEELQYGTDKKYSASFSSTANVAFTITHNLNTLDIITSVRDGLNIISATVSLINTNSILVTTNQSIVSGRINIVGL